MICIVFWNKGLYSGKGHSVRAEAKALRIRYPLSTTLTQYLFWLTILIPFHLTCTINCSPDPWFASPMPLPLYQYSSYYILNPLPYYWSMTSPPLYLYCILGWWLTSLYPYHSLGLWLSSPLPLPYYRFLTRLPSLPAYPCTTTYGLVCARFPYIYKPYIPQLYSLTWIYLVLPSYLVHNLLSLISLYLWSLASLWPVVIASKDHQKPSLSSLWLRL
jgi:hypothetical protein